MRLKIEKLVYGGAGLARTEQGVIFVPRSAAGDLVEAEVVNKKKDYATARIVQLLEPSTDRQEPYCPNYHTAGCCHWQHIRYDRQVQYKENIIRETLQRGAHLRWDGNIKLITGSDRHYRMRAVFHVTDGRLGFVQENTHKVVPITSCSALVGELNDFIGTVDASGVREVYALSAP
jgi:23S rRNA (uracil1939-C5)-methyltransferase